jgi:mannose-6-phosphate isomerase-like protein (cupin superfamily)
MEIPRNNFNTTLSVFQEQFEANGYAGPVQIFSSDLAERISKQISKSGSASWSKGYAVSFRDYYDIATNPAILDRVSAILGDDVMLWGASMVIRQPGKVHAWHSDLETVGGIGRTVSVWLGLDNVNHNSSLQVIRHSHKFGVSIQEMRYKSGIDREEIKPKQVLRWAEQMDRGARLLACSMKNGDAVFFDGNLWHGTDNLNLTGTRKALLIQYATPDRRIQVPSYNHLDWPFQFRDDFKPPCIMVKGSDKYGVNDIVSPPSGSSNIKSWIVELDLPLQDSPSKGWKPHRIHFGRSPAMETLTCHASVLNPGHSPHPPHRHSEEEILIVLDGSATILLGEVNNQQAKIIQRGEFAYYPAGQLHTIRNDSNTNTTYVMFKWDNPNRVKRVGELLKATIVTQAGENGAGKAPETRMWSFRRLLQGQTQHLSKLHSHISVVKPGGGYEPHSDKYDVALVILSGTVETLGQKVGPNGVIFYFTDEPHGIKNIGVDDAVYLVFEFHTRTRKKGKKQLIKKAIWTIQGYIAPVLPSSARTKARKIIAALGIKT